MMIPRVMNSSIGATSVFGQFARRPACSRNSPTVATRLSHSALRCGSSARVFSVRMPWMLSTRTLLLADSAAWTRPTSRPTGLRNSMMMPAIMPAPISTVHASVTFSQNSRGSRNSSVTTSRKVPISLPLTNSRTRFTCMRRKVVCPAWLRSKKSSGSDSSRLNMMQLQPRVDPRADTTWISSRRA